MIVVAGHLRVAPEDREAFLARSRDAMVGARRRPACLDFVVVADPLVPDRVHVYERWADADALRAFRGAGPDDGLAAMILGAEVEELAVSPIDVA